LSPLGCTDNTVTTNIDAFRVNEVYDGHQIGTDFLAEVLFPGHLLFRYIVGHLVEYVIHGTIEVESEPFGLLNGSRDEFGMSHAQMPIKTGNAHVFSDFVTDS
jgi:hypothetical protein